MCKTALDHPALAGKRHADVPRTAEADLCKQGWRHCWEGLTVRSTPDPDQATAGRDPSSVRLARHRPNLAPSTRVNRR